MSKKSSYRIKTSYRFVSIVLISFILQSCKQQGKVAENTNSFKRHRRPEMISSVIPVQVKNLKELQGLWVGRFEAEPAHKLALVNYDAQLEKLYAKMENDERYVDDLEVYNQLATKISAKDKKWMFKNPLFGYWEPRRPNSISIKIDKIVDDSVWGSTVCAGNERPIQGTISVDDSGMYKLQLNEPGDDKYDGAFSMIFGKGDSLISGKWKPYDASLSVKSLEVRKVDFKYLPNADEWGLDQDFLNKNISIDILVAEDIENQSRQRLRILRNLIYARHGYSFKNKDIRTFFDAFEWYVPLSTDIRKEITAVEHKNIQLMKRYEDYAEDYYDDFGR